ncbi:hypothetical protein Bbelb_385580 [Branchiostoma belcheri]|nr:hypothetical protein Bbelb_385580 [Branchiostoma belcheri]
MSGSHTSTTEMKIRETTTSKPLILVRTGRYLSYSTGMSESSVRANATERDGGRWSDTPPCSAPTTLTRVKGSRYKVQGTVPGEVYTTSAATCETVICIIVFVVLPCSVWEWTYMYKMKVAEKTLELAKDHPECNASLDTQGYWESFKSWASWMMSWSDHDPCEKYYKTVLVNPALEVNPLMALSAAVTRPCVTAMELVSEGLGRSMRLLFKEIPAQWQLLVMLMYFLLLILILAQPLILTFICLKYSRDPIEHKADRTHVTQLTHDADAGRTHVTKSSHVAEHIRVGKGNDAAATSTSAIDDH